MYICPLCCKSYFIETKSGVIGNSEFSLDHLPPKSVGGTYKMITCKKCNNDSGTFESELEKVLNFAVDKKRPNEIVINVRVQDEETGECIQGLAHNKDGVTNIIFNEQLKRHRKDYIDFLNRLDSNKMPKINIQVPLYDKKKLERALIKSAYLMCFYWWGYEFVFSDNGALIRDVINGKKDYPCQVPTTWSEKEERMPTGVYILQDGEERKAFLVSLNLKGVKHSTTANVLIPGPSNSAWDNIKLIDEMNNAKESKSLKCITIPRVVDRIGYTISWLIVID